MDALKVKFFTLEEANTMIPEVDKIMDKIFSVKDRLVKTLYEIGEMKKNVSRNGNRRAMQEKLRQVAQLHNQLSLDQRILLEKGIIPRDLEKGYVDFPTIIQGDLGYLCWKKGEPHVDYWHKVGDSERYPINSDVDILGFNGRDISDN